MNYNPFLPITQSKNECHSSYNHQDVIILIIIEVSISRRSGNQRLFRNQLRLLQRKRSNHIGISTDDPEIRQPVPIPSRTPLALRTVPYGRYRSTRILNRLFLGAFQDSSHFTDISIWERLIDEGH